MQFTKTIIVTSASPLNNDNSVEIREAPVMVGTQTEDIIKRRPGDGGKCRQINGVYKCIHSGMMGLPGPITAAMFCGPCPVAGPFNKPCVCSN